MRELPIEEQDHVKWYLNGLGLSECCGEKVKMGMVIKVIPSHGHREEPFYKVVLRSTESTRIFIAILETTKSGKFSNEVWIREVGKNEKPSRSEAAEKSDSVCSKQS